MNELKYKQAQVCIRVGGTVAVLKRGTPNPIMVNSTSKNKLPVPQANNRIRYFAYGVKLDLKKEWASQWTTAATYVLDDLL